MLRAKALSYTRTHMRALNEHDNYVIMRNIVHVCARLKETRARRALFFFNLRWLCPFKGGKPPNIRIITSNISRIVLILLVL